MADNEKEVWRTIVDDVDFEGAYMVSTFGRVKSLKRKINSRYGKYKTLPEKILSLNKDKNTHYISITLSLGLKRFTRSVHRLVAKTFLNNAENKCCVNHKDHDRTNNNLSNLEWVTKSENALHGKSNKRIKTSWNRDEVEKLLQLALATGCAYGMKMDQVNANSWIKENL